MSSTSKMLTEALGLLNRDFQKLHHLPVPAPERSSFLRPFPSRPAI